MEDPKAALASSRPKAAVLLSAQNPSRRSASRMAPIRRQYETCHWSDPTPLRAGDFPVLTWREMVSTNKVTTRMVDMARPQPKDVFLWDSELAGFGVRVTLGGTKSYIFQYRLGGRGSASRRYTIGRH
jgi:hypothetical protein